MPKIRHSRLHKLIEKVIEDEMAVTDDSVYSWNEGPVRRRTAIKNYGRRGTDYGAYIHPARKEKKGFVVSEEEEMLDELAHQEYMNFQIEVARKLAPMYNKNVNSFFMDKKLNFPTVFSQVVKKEDVKTDAIENVARKIRQIIDIDTNRITKRKI
jgi:hypothetical protein